MATRGGFVETTWVNGAAPGISAQQLQRIEDQIKVLDEVWDGDQLQARDGTVTAPSYGFGSRAGTGWYLTSGGELGVTYDGVGRLRWQAPDHWDFMSTVLTDVNEIHASDGSAGDPSYTFTNSQAAGWYRHGVNQIGGSTNSVTRFILSDYGLAVSGGSAGTPSITSTVFNAKSDSQRVAGAFYRQNNGSDQVVLEVRSNVGGTAYTKWYVDTDGDAIKVSDPRLKSSIKPARSYWEDWKRLGKSGAMIQHGWKGSKDKARLTNWDASKVKKVFPKLTPTYEEEDGTEHLMVNYSALDLISHRVLMEAIDRIEALEAKAEVANGK